MTRSVLSESAPRYRAPDALTRHLLNPAVAWMARRGVSMRGSRVLAVRGRTSGQVRTTPVNVLQLDGEHYLVAPRGITQWVRNLRVAGEGELRLGRRVQRFTAVELGAAEAPAVLRAYLQRWRWEVGVFFEGVGPDSSDEQLRAAAGRHPAFRLHLVGGAGGAGAAASAR